MIIKNSLIVHNNKPTLLRQGFNSCIDHIISNCPSKITKLHTHNGQEIYYGENFFISDHCILTALYNDKDIVVP